MYSSKAHSVGSMTNQVYRRILWSSALLQLRDSISPTLPLPPRIIIKHIEPSIAMQSSSFGFSLPTNQAKEKNDFDDLQCLRRVGKSKVNNKSKPAKETRMHLSFMSSIHFYMYSSDIKKKQMCHANLPLLQKCLCPVVFRAFPNYLKANACHSGALDREPRNAACLLYVLYTTV